MKRRLRIVKKSNDDIIIISGLIVTVIKRVGVYSNEQ